eukprot:14263382-Ditylum_brightwellii.AAC.1
MYEPVDLLYTEINAFADLITTAYSLVTDQQKIVYVYLALQCTGKFYASLTAWNNHPCHEHKWANCQPHF